MNGVTVGIICMAEDLVLVAICTKDRPVELARCLQGLAALDYGGAWSVLVVDNSPVGSAKSPAESAQGLPALQYVGVPVGGLAVARNRAIEVARVLGADSLAFIDDDEVPEPNWLNSLVRASGLWPGAVITGPVVPECETAPPAWDPDLSYFTRANHQDGDLVDLVGIGNALLPGRLLELGISFDPAFEYYGEDTEFLLRWKDLGGDIRWTSAAVVREWILPERLDVDFPRQRAKATTAAWVRVSISRGGSPGFASGVAGHES